MCSPLFEAFFLANELIHLIRLTVKSQPSTVEDPGEITTAKIKQQQQKKRFKKLNFFFNVNDGIGVAFNLVQERYANIFTFYHVKESEPRMNASVLKQKPNTRKVQKNA